MKKFFSSPQLMEVMVIKNLLENAGIPAEVRNEQLYSNIPGIGPEVELWLLNDGDEAVALQVKADWRNKFSHFTGCWVCSECGEKLEEQFTSCWHCGGKRTDSGQASEQLLLGDPADGKRRPVRVSREMDIFLSGLAGCVLLIIAGLALSKILHGDYDVHWRAHPHFGGALDSREFLVVFFTSPFAVLFLWRAISLLNMSRQDYESWKKLQR